ncbi:MAG: tetratricopeptide repeat protein, partial [Planctomycetota bacterium]
MSVSPESPSLRPTAPRIALAAAVLVLASASPARPSLAADSSGAYAGLEKEAHKLELAGRFLEAQDAFAQALVAAATEAAKTADGAGGPAGESPGALFLWAWCEVLAENAHLLTSWTSRPAELIPRFEKARAAAEYGRRGAPADGSPEVARARRELVSWLTWRLAELRLRAGKPELAAAEWGKLGFVTDWRVIGPFENEKGGGFRVPYPPEKEIDFEAVYKGKKHPVRWRAVPVDPPDGVIDLDAMLRPNEECIAYAVTFVRSGERRPVELRIAADDGYEMWLNGAKLASREVERACFFDQDVVQGTLEAGWNRILVKVADMHIAWEFSLRITTPLGELLVPGEDIEVSSFPERRTPRARGRAPAGTGPGAPGRSPAERVWEPGGAISYFQRRLSGVVQCRDGAMLEVALGREGFGKALSEALGQGGDPRAKALAEALRRFGPRVLKDRSALETLFREKTAAQWAAALLGFAWERSRADLARLWYGVARLRTSRGAHGVKDHPDRIALARAQKLVPLDPVYLYALARVASDWVVMEAERNENPRVKLLKDLLDIEPRAAVAHYELASHYLRRQENPARAIEHARLALDITKEFPLAELLELDCYSRRGWGELAR